jgi:hypothetical protein
VAGVDASGLPEQAANAAKARVTIRDLQRMAGPLYRLFQTCLDLGLRDPCAKPKRTYIRLV